MRSSNPVYAGSPPAQDDRSPLHKCTCKRLNTLKDYRANNGKCPACQKAYVGEDD